MPIELFIVPGIMTWVCMTLWAVRRGSPMYRVLDTPFDIDWGVLAVKRKRDIWKLLTWPIVFVVSAVVFSVVFLAVPIIAVVLWWRELPN